MVLLLLCARRMREGEEEEEEGGEEGEEEEGGGGARGGRVSSSSSVMSWNPSRESKKRRARGPWEARKSCTGGGRAHQASVNWRGTDETQVPR